MIKPNCIPPTAASCGNRPCAHASSFVPPSRDRTGRSERGTLFCGLRGGGAVMEATRDPEMTISMGGTGKNNIFVAVPQSDFTGFRKLHEGRRKNCAKRVILDFSSYAAGFRPCTRRIDVSVPDYRGVSRVFSEQRARHCRDEHRLKSVSVRICPRFPEPVGRRTPTAWISHPDSAHLTECGLSAPPAEHAGVYGVSKNDSLSRDNQPAAHLGRRPGDNAGNRRSELESPAEPHGRDDLTTAVHGCGFSAAGRCKD